LVAFRLACVRVNPPPSKLTLDSQWIMKLKLASDIMPLRSESDLGGIPLDTLVESSGWHVPDHVELRGEHIVGWYDKATGGSERTPRIGKPGPLMLERFVALADQSPDRFVAFAQKWGLLDLCRHGLPSSHVTFSPQDDNDPQSEARYCSAHDGDSIVDWQLWASSAQAAVRISRRLHMGTCGEERDWICLLGEGWQKRFSNPDQTPMQAAILASVLSDWLAMARARPRLSSRDPRHPRFKVLFECESLFGGLAVQLMYAVAQADGFAVCTICGQPYYPKRRPAAGRNNYCSNCVESGTAAGFAVLDSRRRKSAKNK